jgi:hypothetical protein
MITVTMTMIITTITTTNTPKLSGRPLPEEGNMAPSVPGPDTICREADLSDSPAPQPAFKP